MSIKLTIEVPESLMPDLHVDAEGVAREFRLVAAVKWYEMELLSQGKAAEVAGLTRSEFIDALGRFRVSPFQGVEDDIEANKA